MKTPSILLRLQSWVRHVIPSGLIPNDTFIHFEKIQVLEMAWRLKDPISNHINTEAFRSRLIKLCIPFIRAIWPEVNSKWRNTHFCPKTAIGDYIWTFQCETVQQILWLKPEFVQGFRYALGPMADERCRDANPYQNRDRDRDVAWDIGYILALAVRRDSKENLDFKKWLAWLEAGQKVGAQ